MNDFGGLYPRLDALRYLAKLPSRKYKLFVSHAWDATSDYRDLVNLLEPDSSFRWDNLSVSKDDPLPEHPTLPRSDWHIFYKLSVQIQQADCVLVFAKMDFHYRDWLQTEIDAAMQFNKPIIPIRVKGQERIPDALRRVTTIEPVYWYTKSIVDAIKTHALPEPRPVPTLKLPAPNFLTGVLGGLDPIAKPLKSLATRWDDI
jgi:hypothetical protein